MEEVWLQAKSNLAKVLTHQTFTTWIEPLRFAGAQKNGIILEAPNQFIRDRVMENYLPMILESVRSITDSLFHVEVRVATRQQDTQTPDQVKKTKDDVIQGMPRDQVEPTEFSTNLNPRYTFDTFVCGGSNQFAHAAALSVANNPAGKYNPLFIYGGVGLGKTHLLTAIGNQVLANNQKARVCFYTSEKFMNELINCLRYQKMEQFRNKFRKMDLLLIDDIQFIAGKERTQEEFFHTFNALHGQEKQLVMSSDRPPKAMVTLEERLRSRFEWGLTADLQPPDLETRMAILRTKAERSGRQVPGDILELIARQIQSNIRELEGALTRVLAYADLRDRPLTSDLVNVALADLLPQRSTVEPRTVIDAVSRSFGVPRDRLLGRDRTREVALPRQVAMYLMREAGNISLPQIGEEMGGRDHTTVMYACEKVADMIERDDRLRRQVIQIREELFGQRSRF